MSSAAAEKLETPCPECGKRLRYPSELGGRKGKCSCGAVVLMPRPADAVPPQASIDEQVQDRRIRFRNVPRLSGAGKMHWSLKVVHWLLRAQGCVCLILFGLGVSVVVATFLMGDFAAGAGMLPAAVVLMAVGAICATPYFAAAEILRMFWQMTDDTRRQREISELQFLDESS